MITPLILSGGSGTRLWPLSREAYPKQFLPLNGDGSLFQATLERLRALPQFAAPLVVCNQTHRFMVAQQMYEAGFEPGAILLEPLGRNTAPAVALGALQALESDPDATLLVLPADHVINQAERFAYAVKEGEMAARQGALVTFGVLPTRAETGYGYIKGEGADGVVQRVERFVEKPDLETAERYITSGAYYWNSGIFMFRADRYLDTLARYEPDMVEACRQAHAAATRDLDFIRIDELAFARCPSNSIDYAVMERTDEAVVVAMDAEWSDLGSWAALQDVAARDEDDNVLLGDVLAADSRGCYLRAESRLLATVGLQDHVVVETADAVLVAHRDRVQDVKIIVQRLQDAKRDECTNHRRVYRPWGSYEGVAMADRFQAKRIVVNPGHQLSLQMHHHRAEHWIVVRGTAEVECDGKTFLLSEDESTYIPLGTRHRLKNPGVIPLELIEVQTGSYLGEDDIIRFEDNYGRGSSLAAG
ncbi:mannose-1-phosphate guanylyltransferase/mannose-6-phosphate isomerase [Alkalilimnicola ehrlichii]|uniref:mannose-1-phosphate guanylyltransferase n=1 Tax=Alkalilimnicola ehrlichii TaxID=351052 RepID=A0A3E0WXV2_9GAMM|nr:mannose-1-phosphate guanylyltransferase/mannose-6-phosphate isomerase [Alkalilimnicola ehrlichii]RFA30261.1 mannose-1-phosphate guanylyltransferase/mannose-6-phosphate isomerase [Alkalilimnicola ehrlichii]RFA37840.1 mannose-1-phosphate guanylyltransferase/mannose-6-phosphate isomerase [Alkalilimnicola ehrlichii]